MVACIADVRGSILSAVMFFFFFFKNLSFLASYDTLDDPLERPSRRSIARSEGPVRTPLPTILRLDKGRRPGLGHPSNFAQLGEGFLGFRVEGLVMPQK